MHKCEFVRTRRRVGDLTNVERQACEECWEERVVLIRGRSNTCLWCTLTGMLCELLRESHSGPCPDCGRFWAGPVKLGPTHAY